MKKLTILLAVCLTACQMPQWRVFQKETPKPVEKNARQIETDRQAAKVLAQKIEKPEVIKPVAEKLSQSLGEPSNSISGEKDIGNLIERQTESILTTQEARKKQDAFLASNAGTKLEGTGFNLFGPLSSLGVIGFIVLCVAFPPVVGVLLKLLFNARNALTAVIAGGESFDRENPEAAKQLRGHIAEAMHAATNPLRKSVRKIKEKL